MNFRRRASDFLVYFWMAPMAVEFGLWLLFFVGLAISCSGKSEGHCGVDFRLAAQIGLVLCLVCTAFRQRIDPVLSRFFGGLAIFTALATVLQVVKEALFDTSLTASGWAKVLYGLTFFVVVLVGGGGMVVFAYLRGVRTRHQAIPDLIRALSAKRKGLRRKAILALTQIAIYDQGSSLKCGPPWLWSLWQWLSKSDTPTAMADAIRLYKPPCKTMIGSYADRLP